ncbi:MULTISPECIES: asparagine synthase-related protein [Streptomyces]|uniref:asparagine synthase-related protein n=1 Tax=Streptomyces TaxID=1883 RepID=UPI000B2D2D63
MAQGLEVRVPYCHHRLVQYAFNVPWAMKSYDGREKNLLRAAGARLVWRERVTCRPCVGPGLPGRCAPCRRACR